MLEQASQLLALRPLGLPAMPGCGCQPGCAAASQCATEPTRLPASQLAAASASPLRLPASEPSETASPVLPFAYNSPAPTELGTDSEEDELMPSWSILDTELDTELIDADAVGSDASGYSLHGDTPSVSDPWVAMPAWQRPPVIIEYGDIADARPPPSFGRGFVPDWRGVPNYAVMVRKIAQVPRIVFDLTLSLSRASQHCEAVLRSCLRDGPVYSYKWGVTRDPAHRWENDLYGYGRVAAMASLSGYSAMFLLHVATDPDEVADLEASLILGHHERPACGNRLAGIRRGIYTGDPPHFLYLVIARRALLMRRA